MKFPRAGGILLHPTSLPGRFGIGDFGPEAERFLDWLREAGQRIWQVLPLGPTGYGDSPYQCFSAFAGNPLLISPDKLADHGYISKHDLADAPESPEDRVQFETVIPFKLDLLRRAFRGFSQTPEYRAFEEEHHAWLDPFARFLALKRANGEVAWTEWDKSKRASEAEIALQKWMQFEFFRQWNSLKWKCREYGIRVMGDIPIYVAHDSADVWARPDLWDLDPDGRAWMVAGVPPDYFSATGQLWGNPIYRWARIAENGYAWWIERLRATLNVVDMIRLDHFRGFEAYWEVPGTEPTAMHGRWVKGPGAALFEAAEKALGELPVVAENLGVITPEVEAIRHQFHYPGMSILQFAFGNDPQAPTFRPHNYPREVVAYTGTHDNDTTVGWWTSFGAGDSTRTQDEIEKERAQTRAYLNTDGREIHWAFIRTIMASVADTALVPMQDVLGLGSEARMNLPGSTRNHWRWRCKAGDFREEHATRLHEYAKLYDR